MKILKDWKLLPMIVGIAIFMVCLSKRDWISGLIIAILFGYYILNFKDKS